MAILRSFGNNPSRKDVEIIKTSPNYKNGIFQNLSSTPSLVKGANMAKIMWRFFNKPKNTAPPKPLTSVKTDLRSLPGNKTSIVWFGHSSYFIHLNGKNFLVDPVFSGYASPFSFTAKSFKGADVYTADDFPTIDILILTHDHYDHLDYNTVKNFRSKTKKICTSAGVGSHLRYWGFDANSITEFDWWDSKQIMDDTPANPIEIIAAPARHFSGRSLTRNKTLWSSFILKAGNQRIYIGADSGYDSHFKTIGDKYGPFDIALLECGQYNEWWPYIHMMPEETVQAGIDLKAERILPVHWAKFSLSLADWDDPIKRVTAEAARKQVILLHPMIGEAVDLDNPAAFSNWWEQVK